MASKRALSHILIAAVLALSAMPLCLAAYWSIRLAAADLLSRADSIPNVERAAHFAPANPRYLLRLADLQVGDGRDASPILRQAVKASPLDSTVWLQLGLQAELNGDIAAAEQALLRAAELDRRFRPRWNLASFYVRRNDPRQSWHWANEALRIGQPGDFAAVFRLCWSVSAQADDIWHYAIPKTPLVLEQYLQFLLAENKLDAAQPVAAQLVEIADTAQVQSLLLYSDAAIAGKRVAPAISCWNRMSRRGLIPYPVIDVATGKSLVNGDFAHAPLGLGFDWRLANLPGVAVHYEETTPHLRIVFSGKQPEFCETVVALLALQPLRKYRLTYRYDTVGIAPGSGLKWQLYNSAEGAQIIPEAPSLSHEGETTAQLEFLAPATFQLGRLALVYQRAPGTVRIEGSVNLANVSLEFAP